MVFNWEKIYIVIECVYKFYLIFLGVIIMGVFGKWNFLGGWNVGW